MNSPADVSFAGKPKTKFKIWNWNKDYWHYTLSSGNLKNVLEFNTYEDALARVSNDNLTGAEIWKLEGAPMVAIQRLT